MFPQDQPTTSMDLILLSVYHVAFTHILHPHNGGPMDHKCIGKSSTHMVLPFGAVGPRGIAESTRECTTINYKLPWCPTWPMTFIWMLLSWIYSNWTFIYTSQYSLLETQRMVPRSPELKLSFFDWPATWTLEMSRQGSWHWNGQRQVIIYVLNMDGRYKDACNEVTNIHKYK